MGLWIFYYVARDTYHFWLQQSLSIWQLHAKAMPCKEPVEAVNELSLEHVIGTLEL